jgi:hypothetical protein
MKRIWAAALLLTLGGCSVNAGGTCFSKRSVIIPDRTLSLANVTNGQSGRELAEAVLDGRHDDALTMLARDPRLATTQVTWDKGRSTERPKGQYGDLLTFAVARCDVTLIDALLAAGLPVDGAQVGEALTLALLADKPDMAQLLLTRGASPDPQKRGGTNAMQEVAAFGQTGAAMMLLRHGLDLNWQDEFGNGHLENAVDMEQYRIATLLIDKGANAWRVGGAGNMAVQNIARPLVVADASDEAARVALETRLKSHAAAHGLPWPPPDFKAVRHMMLNGQWPSDALRAAGVPTASPIAMADLHKRFGTDGKGSIQ